MDEKDIIGNALNNMQKITGIKATYHGGLYLGAVKQRLVAEIKNEVRMVPANLGAAFKKEGGILMAGYITPQVREQLKENNINYLDAAGNCFIRFKDIFIFIEGRKVTPVRERPDGKLWTAPGIKYLWAFLQNPGLVNAPYRTQATTAGVALGRIGDFIAELKNNAYLAATKHGLVIENRKDLENKWVELYPRVLKPKILMGTFRFQQQLIPGTLPKEMLWGGEPAAAAYTKFLHPEIYTIYTWTDKMTAMKKLRLIPDPNGKVLLYEGFWQRPFDGTDLAPITIVYAELLATGDSRNIETAQRLKRI
jgi:hypothetical protein